MPYDDYDLYLMDQFSAEGNLHPNVSRPDQVPPANSDNGEPTAPVNDD